MLAEGFCAGTLRPMVFGFVSVATFSLCSTSLPCTVRCRKRGDCLDAVSGIILVCAFFSVLLLRCVWGCVHCMHAAASIGAHLVV